MLADFIAANRNEIMTRYRAKAATTSLPLPPDPESEYPARAFVDELLSAQRVDLRSDRPDGGAVHHRNIDVLGEPSLARRIARYGEICESITELAMEMNAPVTLAESLTLDRSVDVATAQAVKDSVSERAETTHASAFNDRERLRIFQQEVLRLVETSILSFDGLRTGSLGLEGRTGCLLDRSLVELRSLANRVNSVAD